MEAHGHKEFLTAASAALSGEEAELLWLLHRFTRERLEAVVRTRRRFLGRLRENSEEGLAVAELHSLVRECWAVLDGLAREVNLCMQHLFPEAGLFPPMEMSRQCTFYVVRKMLHENPTTADHPVSKSLWEPTRGAPAEPYERLSFLYNLSLFLPVRVVENSKLPGSDDVPSVAQGIVKGAAVKRCEAVEGTEETLRWLHEFVVGCYDRLAQALKNATR